MEMHSIDSLRQVHGVDVRPAGTPVSRLSYAGARAVVGALRAQTFVTAMRQAGAFVARYTTAPVARYFRHQNDINHLMRFSDAELKDIGIARDQIVRFVRHGNI